MRDAQQVAAVPSLSEESRDESSDQVLMVMACVFVLLAALQPPNELFDGRARASIPYLLVLPAVAAYATSMQERQWRLLAPPIALLLGGAVSWLLATLWGRPWIADVSFVVLVLARWAPWPRWRRPEHAHVVLWTLALAPILLLVLATATGYTRVSPLPGGARLTAFIHANALADTAFVGVLAASVLRSDGRRRATLILMANLVMLAGTSNRGVGTVTVVAALALAIDHWRRHRVTGMLARMWPWLAFLLLWVPRVLPRFFRSGASSSQVLGVHTSGRMEIWRHYVETNDLVVGEGLERVTRLIVGAPAHHSPHNVYIWSLVALGVVGSIVILTGWVIGLVERARWMVGARPEVLATIFMLPLLALIDDIVLTISLTGPLLVLFAAAGTPTAPGGWQAATRSGSREPA